MDGRLPGWTADGVTWYTHEGGEIVEVSAPQETYTTNASEVQNAVYTLTEATIPFPEFVAFRKIPRLFRDCVITEKIDGTNASITILEDGQIRAGSRTRYVYRDIPKTETTKKQVLDNYGFAAWVEDNKEELLKLGKGRFYGEWHGKGINRGYGLEERRFSLFHTRGIEHLPSCVGVVPELYAGPFSLDAVRSCIESLRESGSVAVPGFMNPEGVVVYHEAAGQLFKVTLENDNAPKGQTK